MSTVLPLGTARCQACHEPVAIVRRTVEVGCTGPDCLCLFTDQDERLDCKPDHTHALPDLAWAVVGADGERHLCPVAA